VGAFGAAQPRQRDIGRGAFTVGLFSILVVGGAARFYQLSELPLWMDEVYSYFVSTQRLDQILFNNVDNHPPLFYALQHLWTAINPDIGAIRIPAATIGTLTVLIVTLATSDLLSRLAGLVAGAFLALSTGHIYFSQDARMYPLLAFGLALATWGLVGLADRDRRKYYAILYLIGATIAVYSQIVALIYLAILNGLTVACAWLTGNEKRGFYLWWLGVNVVLLIISLPWLLSIPKAMGAFSGLRPASSTLTRWFFGNLVGFPGLPPPFKTLAAALILLVYVIGAVFAWRSGRRTLAAVSIGTLAIYPLALALLNLVIPILANRVFIPCVIPASMLCGGAVASLRRPITQMVLLVVVLPLAASSAIEAHRLQVKPEDMPQALALADTHGFAGAPILTCHFLTAATAHLYAPGRLVFFPGKGSELIRFDDRILEAISLPIAERWQVDGGSMPSFLFKHGLVVNPATEWNSVEQVVVISVGCDMTRLLTSLGFHKVDAPILTYPGRVIFESLWTELGLWSR
jgi:hypothetical protein